MLVLLLCLGVVIGALLPWQPIINTRLSLEVGSPIWSGFISFLGGAIVLGVLALFQGDVQHRWNKIAAAPWWTLTGGILGTTFVLASIFLIPRVGSTTMSISFICGQLIMSVLLDHFGWGGFMVREITPQRLFGLGLLLLGVFLVVKTNNAHR